MSYDYLKDDEAPKTCHACGGQSMVVIVDHPDPQTGYADVRAYCWDCFAAEMGNEKANPSANTGDAKR